MRQARFNYGKFDTGKCYRFAEIDALAELVRKISSLRRIAGALLLSGVGCVVTLFHFCG